MSETPLGRFGWHELLTSDPDSSQSFYKQVTNWGTMAWDSGPTPYTMWMNDETPVGGVMSLPAEAEGAPPHWIAYLTTPDADDTIARAKELGGSVVWGPLDIPEVGRLASLTDPQGAVFAILQPAGEAPGHDNQPGVGEFSWHELATSDWEGAWDFYSQLFGWEKTDTMDMGEMGTYQMYGRGAHPLGGMFNKPPEMAWSNWLLYVTVTDVNAAAEKVKELGGQVLNGPMEVPGGDIVAQCLDPQGAAFALHALAAPA